MLCAAAVAFKALSVSVAVPVRLPTVCGLKPMLRLQAAPGRRENDGVQSARGNVPLDCRKFALTAMPGATAFSGSVPMFRAITDCGLSLLRSPILLVANVMAGGWER